MAELSIPLGGVTLEGDLTLPRGASGVVVFAHGSGSSRHSPRNQLVAEVMREGGFGTLLFDLLTRAEGRIDEHTAHLRFDVDLLAERLAGATRWLHRQVRVGELPLGYFGASTGAAAALVAAAREPDGIAAVVSRGGRPDLAGALLPRVRAPTLLIVGSRDDVVVRLNQEALAMMRCERRLELVAGATHLFEEPGTLAKAATLAARWFGDHFGAQAPRGREATAHHG